MLVFKPPLQTLSPVEKLRAIDRALKGTLTLTDRIWLEGERKRALEELSAPSGPVESTQASDSVSVERREA